MKRTHAAVTTVTFIIIIAGTVVKTRSAREPGLNPKNSMNFTGMDISHQALKYVHEHTNAMKHASDNAQANFTHIMQVMTELSNQYGTEKLPYPLNVDIYGLLGPYFNAGLRMNYNTAFFAEWLSQVSTKLDNILSSKVD